MSIKKLFGNKQFYKILLLVAIPIIIQQLVTSFVSLLDNLMVGQLGTADIDGVSIANQFLFIFNLGVFGALSGPSIFSTQFFGAKDYDSIRESFRYKWLICIVILIIALLIFIFFDDQLFLSFIHQQSSDSVDPLEVIASGKSYLKIMLLGLLPFVIGEIYSSSLREAKQTVVPMIASVSAVIVNLFLNYLLIFGKFGLPRLGVKGAAIATIISRVISCLIVVVYTHLNTKKYPYMKNIYRHFFPKISFSKTIFSKTFILLINEFLWALGMTLVNQCYSIRGLEVVAACNIVSVFTNLFSILGPAVGNASAVILGQKLGANKLDEAYDDSYKFLMFSALIGIFVACIMALLNGVVPSIYKTTPDVIKMSEYLILISAVILPIKVYSCCTYFIIRTGGKVYVTFMFDSVFNMIVRVPFAFLLSKFTSLSIYSVFFIVEITEIIKCIIGTILVKKGIWIQKLVKEKGELCN